MSINRSLYLVTTNYDWPDSSIHLGTTSTSRLLDIFGEAYEGFKGEELEKKMMQICNKSIFPCLELRRGSITLRLDKPSRTCGHHEVNFAVQFEKIDEIVRDCINLKHPDLQDHYVTMHIPTKMDYIDLLFDFRSNKGCYDTLFRELGRDFQIQRIFIDK